MAASAPAIEVVALVNSGYEAGRSEIILPTGLAQRLGWWPSPPGAIVQTYGSAGGSFEIYRLPDALQVETLAPDRAGPAVLADAAIAPGDREVLVSDALAGPLGLVLLDLARGIWAFRDDLARSLPSEPRQLW
jgi:hypothetical protein